MGRGVEQRLIEDLGGPTYGNKAKGWNYMIENGQETLFNKKVGYDRSRTDRRATGFEKAYNDEALISSIKELFGV